MTGMAAGLAPFLQSSVSHYREEFSSPTSDLTYIRRIHTADLQWNRVSNLKTSSEAETLPLCHHCPKSLSNYYLAMEFQFFFRGYIEDEEDKEHTFMWLQLLFFYHLS
ncbi:hypothetical protein AVEN_79438-1 [Araneus ventricosus]|uniref:Uncharacterized protein n=1 Tax=Araneus ventricosus TaxID=182803 RepID=A0A4Y2I2L0_ARAVE|nr:hypothetical protein AVEN_79438-1 [Araneus ventricosus]